MIRNMEVAAADDCAALMAGFASPPPAKPEQAALVEQMVETIVGLASADEAVTEADLARAGFLPEEVRDLFPRALPVARAALDRRAARGRIRVRVKCGSHQAPNRSPAGQAAPSQGQPACPSTARAQAVRPARQN